MRILIINGSHKKGNTDIAVENIIIELNTLGVEMRNLVLRDIEMKLPDGCEVCAESGICPNIQDQFAREIEPSIQDYDIYLIATPIWSDGVTPLTKIFWDRIVSWCSKDRMYLKDKKLAIVAHGMADPNSWVLAINWVKGICIWEESVFAGSFTFTSGSKIGSTQIDKNALHEFVLKLTSSSS